MLLRGCSIGNSGNGGEKGQYTFRQRHEWRRRVRWRLIHGINLSASRSKGISVEIEVPANGCMGRKARVCAVRSK